MPDKRRIIRKASQRDYPAMVALLRQCAADMQASGNDQWDSEYPPAEKVASDIARGTAWVCEQDGEVCGMFAMDDDQPPEYASVQWRLRARRVAVIHRLAVRPAHHRRGIASAMMDFAEHQAAARGCDVMRLDTYSRNTRSMPLFPSRGYSRVGQVHFRDKPAQFYCFEKRLCCT